MLNETGLEWHRVASTSDIPEEDVIRVEVGALAIALYRVKGEYYATDDCCTHQEARLSDGFVIGDVIECPLHQGRFHIPTGKAKRSEEHTSELQSLMSISYAVFCL